MPNVSLSEASCRGLRLHTSFLPGKHSCFHAPSVSRRVHRSIMRCRSQPIALSTALQGVGKKGFKGKRGPLSEIDHLAAQWHPSKNGDRQPTDISVGSSAIVWWICPEGCRKCGRPHEWQAAVGMRAYRRTGCPFCSGNKCCECGSLAAQRPDLMEEWDRENNDGLDPKQISLSSARVVAWRCSKDRTHGGWAAQVYNRLHGTGCPRCAMAARRRNWRRRGLVRDEFPELIKQLHPTKNPHINLDKVTSGSSKEAVWVCKACQNDPPGCPHPREWHARIMDRTVRRQGCPYCSGNKVCPCNSLATLVPEVAAEWHPTKNKGKQPDQYAQHSSCRVWWQHTCEQTGQVIEWQACIAARVTRWQKFKNLSRPRQSKSSSMEDGK